jgi:hypothetical protein
MVDIGYSMPEKGDHWQIIANIYYQLPYQRPSGEAHARP